jgi:hypothetical protein
MVDFIIASVAILVLLSGWLLVQQLARRYAARHPELGPAREEGSGCGKSCLCTGGRCSKKYEQPGAALDSNDITINRQEDQLR